MNREYKGVLPSPPDERDWHIDRCMDMPVGSFSFPKTFKVSWLPDYKDQGQVNSCTAFALALIFECIYKRIYGDVTGFSTGYLYGNRMESEYKDEGEIMRDAIKGACIHGDVKACLWDNNYEVPKAIEAFEAAYPKLKEYAHKLVRGYVRIRGEDEARAHLMKYDIPLFACAKMKKIHPLSKSDGYHAIAVTGWIKTGEFECRNSWGKYDCPDPELYFDEFAEVWGVIPMTKETFKDVKTDEWGSEAIYEAVNDGILQGMGDGIFSPDTPLTRRQISLVWQRMKRYMDERYEKNL